MQVDQDRLNQFLGQVVGELGAAMNAALVIIGDRLGLHRALAGVGRAAETPFNLVYEARA